MTQKTLDIMFHPRILVVDDEKRIRDACYKMLSEEGFEVELAETGEAGLQKIDAAHFDIILLDLMMPCLSGLDVLPRIRESHPDTVIIVITGYATIEHSVEAMKKGAFDFIPKPFSPQDLRIVIAKALDFIRTLQDIATERSRMRVLINQLGDGVMAIDNQQKVALVNPAFMKMMRCPRENVIGRPVNELIENEKVREILHAALNSEKGRFVEYTAELTSGELDNDQDTMLAVRCVPFRDRLERNLGALTVVHDITALKKIDRMRSDFVSMVAHEIKSPMNTVLMQLKVIIDGLAGPVSEKQAEIINRAMDKIRALADLSTELLELAKIESGLIAQEKEQLDMAEIMAKQTDFYQEDARAKNIGLRLLLDEELPPVLGKKGSLEEVLSNLISNAIRYTPEGGGITVSAAADAHYLCVQVKDTGFGIAPEDQENIFNRFYRVKNEKTRFITGTGLGLAIVKSIIEAHNGQIRLDNRSQGGTRVLIRLPIEEEG